MLREGPPSPWPPEERAILPWRMRVRVVTGEVGGNFPRTLDVLLYSNRALTQNIRQPMDHFPIHRAVITPRMNISDPNVNKEHVRTTRCVMGVYAPGVSLGSNGEKRTYGSGSGLSGFYWSAGRLAEAVGPSVSSPGRAAGRDDVRKKPRIKRFPLRNLIALRPGSRDFYRSN